MDWTQIIGDLEDSGLTQKEIAERAGCSQPYVSQLKRGQRKSPDFQIGQALAQLHEQRQQARA
jgi:transcriptional regulator with XRE-family HTH domain